MIKIENVSFKYKNSEKNVLDNISFDVNDGEIVAIIGENGSGKSTLGRVIAGITKLKQGKIIIDNLNISDKKNYDEIQKKVGIVFQNPDNQIIFNNIYDELSFALKDISREETEKRINDALKQVEMLDKKAQDLYTLSLGQKQRIIIAEILAKNPKILIFDEPTTMIDSQGKEIIYEIIKNLKKQGYTIIYITNFADEILMADRTLILKDGKISCEINKNELIEKADLLNDYNIKQPTLLKLITSLKENGLTLNLGDITIDNIVNALKGRKANE